MKCFSCNFHFRRVQRFSCRIQGGVKIFSGEECSAKRHQGVVFLNQGIFMDVDYLPMAIHTYRLSCTIVQVLSRIRYLSKKVISLTCHQVNHEKMKD